MGTTISSSDEWIELKNISNSEVNVSGWQLIDQAEQIKINLGSVHRTKVGPGEFILLERTDDDSVPTIAADLIYTGALSNTNEGLRLFDSQCNLIDEVLANSDWPAGESSTRKTMERDKIGFGWHTSSIVGGTPKQENSLSVGGGGSGTFPQENATSTPSSTQDQQEQQSQVSSNVNHVLISEIQIASGSSVHDEFLELYNPTENDINLTGWYVQKKTNSATSSFSTFAAAGLFNGKIIKSKSYFLIAHPLSSFAYDISTAYGLAKNNTLALKNPDREIVDEVSYSEINNSESLERKAFNNGICVSAQNEGEFLGNGCDYDAADDFEIRTAPNPQNSSSLPEPRSGPTAVKNFNINFSSSVMGLNFNWLPSQDANGSTSTIVYKIIDISTSTDATSTPLTINNTTSTQAIASIKEIGRNYQFSITPFDQDGLSGSSTIKEIQVPSFLSNLYFYNGQYGLATTTLAEFNFNSYPFIPNISSGHPWKAMVLYFDKDLNESNVAFQLKMSQYNSYIANQGSLVYLDYWNCCMSTTTCKGINFINDSTSMEVVSRSGYMHPLWPTYINTEDGRLVLPVKLFSDSEFFPSAQDYLTIAFYDSTPDYAYWAYPYFNLIAIDKTRYYFQNEAPLNFPPTVPTNLTATSTGEFQYILDWIDSTDPDGLDSTITYEYNFSLTEQEPTGEWQSAVKSPITPMVNLSGPGDWIIYLRAKDSTGLYSDSATTTVGILEVITTEDFSTSTEEISTSTQAN